MLLIYVALLTMVSSMFAAVLGMFWHQTRENTKTREENAKTRDLMVRLNHDTRTELLTALSAQSAELRADHKNLADELRADHRSLASELRAGLSAFRDRLSRIEGRLGIGLDPPPAK